MSPSSSLPLSVVILTLNEEGNLPKCLASVANCNQIVVVDSGSTDTTVALAQEAGAQVVHHPFKDFADQRNHAHAAVEFRHPWVFHLDADEQMTAELATECAALDSSAPFDGYFAAPRMMFDGHWMRRCTDFPAWQARCVRAKGFRFIQIGHGQREAPEMRMGFLRGNYLHDISAPDQEEWERKHRHYARQEAQEFLRQRRAPGRLWQAILRGPPLERRRALKHVSYRLPCRPFARFLYQYVLRGGFRDGPSAARYCRLLARYERFAVEEIQRQLQSVPHA